MLLIFIPADELRMKLENRLGKQTAKIWVMPGTENKVEGNTIAIAFNDMSAYQWLGDLLLSMVGIQPVELLHFWGYGEHNDDFEMTQQRTLYSLKELLKLLLHKLPVPAEHITVFTSGVFDAMSSDYDPNRTTLIGFLRSARSEEEAIIRHIDFAWNGMEEKPQIMVDEWICTDDCDVLYQQGVRKVQRLKKIQLTEFDPYERLIQNKGNYAVIGGLGNVGIHLSKYLLKNYHAKLLIIGKSDIAQNPQRRNALEELRQLGSVTYRMADISQKQELSQLLKESEEAWGERLQGFFQLAGGIRLETHYREMNEHRIIHESMDNYREMFAAKSIGTKHLLELAGEREKAFFINFSSSNGFFGGSSFSAYSAANSYAQGITAGMGRKEKQQYFASISWSLWDTFDDKTAKGSFLDVSNAKGFLNIAPNEGLDSMECVIQRRLSNVIVGIDGRNPYMNREYHTDKYAKHDSWELYYTTVQNRPLTGYMKTDLPLKQVKALAFDKNGYINNEEMKRLDAGQSGIQEEMTPEQKKMKDIWKHVLGHEDVGLDDKFFEVGGNSIKSIQLVVAINEKLNSEIEISDLFQYTSIRAITSYIYGRKTTESEDLETIGLTF